MTDILGVIRELLEVEKAKATVDRRTDSVELGTPSKGGAMKVYFDASNPDEAKMLVDNAYMIREYAQGKIAGGGAANGGV
jgi:hypothetical protein